MRTTINKTNVLISFFLLATLTLFGQKETGNPLWKKVSDSSFSKKNADRQIIPDAYQTLRLDMNMLRGILKKAPLRFSEQSKAKKIVLTLPLPDGSFEQFHIVKAPIMEPDLAARYPMMQSFAGQGIDDPSAFLRFDVTQKGFHAMVLSDNRGVYFVDPFAKGDTEHYICYFKKELQRKDGSTFICEVEGTDSPFKVPIENGGIKIAGDCQLRTYRLALACTGEYAQFHGGTVSSVMAEYNTAMTRVNGIYERDLAITMVLVANTDQIIFLNATTDPFTNSDGGAMLSQNQTTCDNIIGTANYDIGHVFSTGGGGVAFLAVPCTGNKAGGVTGLANPVGDAFYVDFVAHEMGHQYGANHTFNGSVGSCNGNRNDATAFEPGSGSTIMSYAGICGAQNVQSNSDDHFHANSLAVISSNVIFGSGSTCPVVTPSGNNAPTASTSVNSFTLPISTPFSLTCNGTDLDGGDVLTYDWEQMNNEISTQPPVATNTGGPNFRSISPTTSPTRYFPNLNAILNNATPTWEVLPSVGRSMNFRCTVRDNHLGAGCTDETDVALTFTATAGPFLVTNPNTAAVSWPIGLRQTVSWNVANTDQAPVSCANVDILLSLDGGQTYPITLASGVPNNGSFDITVPNNPTTTARVQVVCSDNVFFDISNQNFTIEAPPTPAFTVTASPTSQTACAGTTAAYTLDLTSLAGFSEAVTLSTTGQPAGVSISFNTNPITPSGMVTMTITNLDSAAPGNYTITINAVSASLSSSVNVDLNIVSGAPPMAVLSAPADGAAGTSLNPLLTWNALPQASSYFVEIATGPAFGSSIIESGSVPTNSYQPSTVSSVEMVYWWRVRADNSCAQGTFSNESAFQTSAVSCTTFSNATLPLAIPSSGTGTYPATMFIAEDFPISDVNTNLAISHTWVGDMQVEITSPSGTTVTLFDRPGVPASDFGCGEDNIVAFFDDAAGSTASDFENSCDPSPPAIQGTFQPSTPLAAFNGESSMGNWTLNVTDNFDMDGGAVNVWDLELCGGSAPPTPNLLTNNILDVPIGQSEFISQAFLETIDGLKALAPITYVLLSLPANGLLSLSGTALPLGIGNTFTQDDINNNLLSYQHDGSATTNDAFDFDVFGTNNGWLHRTTFSINIVPNVLSASANLDHDIDCHNADNAQISVAALGGTSPFTYSLDGVNFQSGNAFSNLAAGTYEVTVKDATGTTLTTNQVTVTNPPAITLSTDVNQDTITATASGGTGALEYSLDGFNFQASPVFNNLANGNYTITARDANGCTEQTNATVAVNTLNVSAAVVNHVRCFGAGDGSISVSVAGGTPAFQYSLNGVDFQASNIFINLAPGDYTVTVLDSDGFTALTNQVTITEPTAIVASAIVDGYDITVTASGGTGALQYSLDGVNFQSSNIFSNNPNGTYDIIVQDENACQQMVSAMVSVVPVSLTSQVSNVLLCHDDNDARIMAEGSGGVPPYQYSLDGVNFQNENFFDNLAAGSYTIIIKDSGGFTASSSPISISNPTAIIASDTVDGYDITVEASGGTGVLQYSLDGINFQSNNIFTSNPNGIYSITIRDENGCIVTATATVDVALLQSLAILETGISCHDANDATISVQVSGGVPPYQYSLNGGGFQNESAFSNLEAGSYVVTVQDAGGFLTSTAAILVANPEAISATAETFGQEITVLASGGSGALQYSLDGINFQSSNVFSELENGQYSIRLKDENDCVTTITAVVNVPIQVLFTITNVSCYDGMDGEIIIEGVNGGIMPYLFSINDGDFLSQTAFSNLGMGEYIFVVQDATGYQFAAHPVFVESPPPIEVSTEVTGNDLTVIAIGGTGQLVYSIDGGGNFQSGNVFTDLPNGTYPIVVKDDNDCEAETNALIDVVTGTKDLALDLLFEVSPNPGSGIFTLKINQSTKPALQLQIFDAAGKRVFQNSIKKESLYLETQLDLSAFASGVYQLWVDDGAVFGRKLLVILK